MPYESSYDSGRLPNKPDLTRGYWAKPSDFIYASISLAFRQDVFSIAWSLFKPLGSGLIFPYTFYLIVFVVPLFVMQSFLGQFSSSGFISSFRVAPIFKGIGYITLAVNLGILTYYSTFAAIPLLYLVHSLRPTLPWSCEGLKSWSYNFTNSNRRHICHLISNNSEELGSKTYNGGYQVPSNLFLRSHFAKENPFTYTDNNISLELVFCTLFVWTLIAALFYKWNQIDKLSRYLRYMIFTTFTLLCISVIRFSLVPNSAIKIAIDLFMPSLQSMLNSTTFTASAFGAGWGTVIGLASYNKFKTNIVDNSWYICFGQMLVFFAFAFLHLVVVEHFEELEADFRSRNNISRSYISQHWGLYLSSGSVLANMRFPNLWCIIFYTMLLLAALVTMITNLLCTLQSLFDEFERLRDHRRHVTLIVIGLLAICSLYTCTSDGIRQHLYLVIDTLVTQTALNLLLILVVLWVYGRVRFQRDMEFMVSRKFATWKVYMLRFVSPLLLLIFLIALISFALFHHLLGNIVLNLAGLFFIILPWLFIPGYIVYILLQTSGKFSIRFKRCCRPMDWYPVESEDRQRYEDTMQNADITHQLNELDEAPTNLN